MNQTFMGEVGAFVAFYYTYEPRQANLCLRAFRHYKF